MASERLRIVQVLEAALGGTKKHVMDLCTGLDPARFELHVLISPLRDPDPDGTRERLLEAGVSVTQIPMRRGPAPFSDLQCLKQIGSYLREVQPDIVHAHSSKAGALARIAAPRAGVKGVVYTPHGFAFKMRTAVPLRMIYRSVERWLGRRTSRIVAVCESEREIAIRAGVARAEQCVVIPNGIDFAPRPAVDREAKLTELGLPRGTRMILCVGDLRPQKGHHIAVAAMPEVLQRAPDAHLVIAGEAEPAVRRLLETNLSRAEVGERVWLLGPRGDVPELLACCEVLCQPSLWEGCPYALIEAAGAGCAIVGSDIPGIRDIVQDGETGWLARPGDAAALSTRLIEALADDEARRARGERAARLARESYSLSRMLELTAGVYEEVANG